MKEKQHYVIKKYTKVNGSEINVVYSVDELTDDQKKEVVKHSRGRVIFQHKNDLKPVNVLGKAEKPICGYEKADLAILALMK